MPKAHMSIKEYETGGGVVLHDGQMLLLERPKRGEIRLPKGHIDPGETAAETALREVAEETGYADLEIVADLGVHVVEFEYQDRYYRRHEHYFLMRLVSEREVPRSPEDEAQFRVCWTPQARAPELLTYLAEQTVAQAALTHIHNTKSATADGP
jgi:8-oxo-dGTP pyrophosphatase MutT (NUDIX family)